MGDLFIGTDAGCVTLEENLKACRRSWEDFTQQLQNFPHSFQLENQGTLQGDQLNKVRTSLQSSLSLGHDSALETARARNLLAFVLFLLKLPTEALHQTQLALESEGEQHNVVSLANQAAILWRQGHRYEAQERVQKLQNLKNAGETFELLRVKARAELAYSYTCFDPSFYPLALKEFEAVAADSASTTGPEQWLWKLGFALTRRRQLRFDMNRRPVDQKEFLDLLSVYQDIVKNCTSHCLRAKAYAEMALVLHMSRSEDVKKELERTAGLTVQQACEKALKLDGRDCSVLWKCGKLFRYLRKIDLSRDLLESAVATRPTSKAYHHLGITYKALATQEKLRESRVRRAVSLLLGTAALSWLVRLVHGAFTLCSRFVGLDLPPLPFSLRLRNAAVTAPGSYPDRINQENYRIFMTQKSEVENSKSDSLRTSSTEAEKNTTGPAEAPSKALNTTSTTTTTTTTTTTATTTATGPSSAADDKASKETYETWKIVKSPRKGAMHFTRKDRYVEKTLEALRKAVQLSEWENAGAAYELALMHKNLGELDQAKEYLEKLLSKEHCLGMFTKINAFEQLGLILKDKSEKQLACEHDRRQLFVRSQSMLLMALKTASAQFSKGSGATSHIGEIWHSFHTLLQALNDQGKNGTKRLHEKAELFRLISDHRQSLAFLQEIASTDPHKANDPEYLKLCIENHVGLQQYNEALFYADMLRCTVASERASRLFEDCRYIDKIGLLAAQQSLLRNPIRSYFREVFKEYVAGQKRVTSSSEDTDTGTENEVPMDGDSTSTRARCRQEKATWDVLILHEDEVTDFSLSAAVANVLVDACGLRVTRNDDDVMGNEPVLDGLLSVMKRSSLVVVLVGHRKVSGRLGFYLGHAARRVSSVTLLVKAVPVPMVMRAHRSLRMAEQLLHVTSAMDCQQFAQHRVAAICHLFAFMVDMDFNKMADL